MFVFSYSALQKQPNSVKMNWMCLNNNFLGMPTKDCKRLVDRGRENEVEGFAMFSLI